MAASYPSLPPSLVVKPDPAAPASSRADPHQLSLRVMRLSRPQLASFAAPALPFTPAAADHLRGIDEDSQLSLPATFGSIYLGQSFPAYVALTNDSSREVARDVAVKIELQTATQRFLLVDTSNHPRPILKPLELCEFLLRHEIKELGVHVLVCAVHYTSRHAPGGPVSTAIAKDERRFFRKFYKFQVMNPLAVKTKVNSRVDGRVFLEVQVQNITQDPMALEWMSMEPVPCFKVRDVNSVISPPSVQATLEQKPKQYVVASSLPVASDSDSGQDGDERESIFGARDFLQPTDTRQYLYLLSPRTPGQLLDTFKSNTLGKLDIVWRFPFGETGRLQTSQLTRRVPQPELIQVVTQRVVSSIPDQPNAIRVERSFTVHARVVNRTEAMMKIQLSAVKAKMGAVLLCGQASRSLGEVRPGDGVDVQLEFLPLAPGLHTVGGVRVSDYVSGESRDVELAEVFVVQHEAFGEEEEGQFEVAVDVGSGKLARKLRSGTLADSDDNEM